MLSCRRITGIQHAGFGGNLFQQEFPENICAGPFAAPIVNMTTVLDRNKGLHQRSLPLLFGNSGNITSLGKVNHNVELSFGVANQVTRHKSLFAFATKKVVPSFASFLWVEIKRKT